MGLASVSISWEAFQTPMRPKRFTFSSFGGEAQALMLFQNIHVILIIAKVKKYEVESTWVPVEMLPTSELPELWPL